MSQLKISFPESSEDNKLQLVDINGSIFAIIHSPLESHGPIHLNCEDWNLILLAPIKSDADIVISGEHIICLSEISSKKEKVKIHASNKLVSFISMKNASGNKFDVQALKKIQFDDDHSTILHLVQLLQGVVLSARSADPSSIAQAQKNFVVALCTLSHKVKGTDKNLTLKECLDVWDVMYVEPPQTDNNQYSDN